MGAHYADDALAEIVADRPGASAYRVSADGSGGSAETRLTVRYLGA